MHNTNALPGIVNVSCWVVSYVTTPTCFLLMIFKRFYIYLPETQTGSNLLVSRCRSCIKKPKVPSSMSTMIGWSNAERHGRYPGFRHSNRLPQTYLIPYTKLYSYTSALLPFQLVARLTIGGRSDLEWPLKVVFFRLSWGHIAGQCHVIAQIERLPSQYNVITKYYLHNHTTLQ